MGLENMPTFALAEQHPGSGARSACKRRPTNRQHSGSSYQHARNTLGTRHGRDQPEGFPACILSFSFAMLATSYDVADVIAITVELDAVHATTVHNLLEFRVIHGNRVGCHFTYCR